MMINKLLNSSLIFLIVMYSSCRQTSNIRNLLTSNDKDSIISGAFKAGKSKNKEFVSLLLQNAGDPRTSTHLKYKGVTVYQAKMMALSKILEQDPPVELSWKIDSSIIKFYTRLAQEK